MIALNRVSSKDCLVPDHIADFTPDNEYLNWRQSVFDSSGISSGSADSLSLDLTTNLTRLSLLLTTGCWYLA